MFLLLTILTCGNPTSSLSQDQKPLAAVLGSDPRFSLIYGNSISYDTHR